MTILKPCPFCGSKTYPTAVLDCRKSTADDTYVQEHIVICQNWMGKGCNAIVGYYKDYTAVQAIKAWNRRAK